MSEGLFVGGSSGSALSGALKYLRSSSGSSIAQDPSANVVVIFPDGVRNYISKPWFLDVAESETTAELKVAVAQAVGRPLDQPGAQAVKVDAAEKGAVLENSDSVDGRDKLGSSVSAEEEVLPNGVHQDGKIDGEGQGQGQAGIVADVLAKLGLKQA